MSFRQYHHIALNMISCQATGVRLPNALANQLANVLYIFRSLRAKNRMNGLLHGGHLITLVDMSC